jgi:hypothetical protein
MAIEGAVEALQTDLEWTISHMVKCVNTSKDDSACIKSAVD